MKPFNEDRELRLKKIFEKKKITRFWDAFKMLTEEAGSKDLAAFEDCIIYFGEERMFEGVICTKMQRNGSSCKPVFLRVDYEYENYHPKLNKLIQFCKDSSIPHFDVYGCKDFIWVELEHDIIIAYVKSEYKKFFGVEITDVVSHAEVSHAEGNSTGHKFHPYLETNTLDRVPFNHNTLTNLGVDDLVHDEGEHGW